MLNIGYEEPFLVGLLTVWLSRLRPYVILESPVDVDVKTAMTVVFCGSKK